MQNPNRGVTDVSSELFFLHRLPFGIYSIRAQLRAESDWRQRVEAVMALVQASAPPTPRVPRARR